jgi:hypothetical protein
MFVPKAAVDENYFTLDAADVSNTIFVLPHDGGDRWHVVTLDWPMSVGIVLSAVPGGSPIIAVSYS